MASVRRRLKMASIAYETLLLESGAWEVSAGEGGTFTMYYPTADDGLYPWQTPRDRGEGQSGRFTLSVAPEETPGQAASGPYTTVVDTIPSISWRATLEPFWLEIRDDAPWVRYVVLKPLTKEMDHLARQWRASDERGEILAQRLPDHFSRREVIKGANHDLAFAAVSRLSLSIDGLHAKLIASRLTDDHQWHPEGFAVPILFPDLGAASWRTVQDLRGHQAINTFRSQLAEIESEAKEEISSGGDLEAAVHRKYQGNLADASSKLDDAAPGWPMTVVNFAIGTAAGFATIGITGPIGPIAGALTGTVIGRVIEISTAQRRKRSSWLALDPLMRAPRA